MAVAPRGVLTGATPGQVGSRARTVEVARTGEAETITVEAAACVAVIRDCWLFSRDRRRAGRLFCGRETTRFAC